MVRTEEEIEAARRLEKAIQRETATFYSSITARRTRNEGRAARLDEMRERRAAMLKDTTRTADLQIETGGTSGKLVAELYSQIHDSAHVSVSVSVSISISVSPKPTNQRVFARSRSSLL